ncbi:MAG: hypothetical protein F4X59_17500 [Holophagales bacterium]|nr:hypothetical protein [Holophagales bacterium]
MSPVKPDLEQEQLAAAMELRNGRIRSPKALCAALDVTKTTYDDVVKRFQDGGPMGNREPRRDRKWGVGTDTKRLLDALVASGDKRFARRRSMYRRHAALAQGARRIG